MLVACRRNLRRFVRDLGNREMELIKTDAGAFCRNCSSVFRDRLYFELDAALFIRCIGICRRIYSSLRHNVVFDIFFHKIKNQEDE